MSKKTDITENEYLSALDKLLDDRLPIDQSALTVSELSKRYKRSYSHTGKIVQELVRDGKLERVKKMREDGRMTVAYRPTKK